VWKPANNKVHIIQEQVAYTQIISKSTQEALKGTKFELGKITDIQFPVQDWGPVIQDIKKAGAGVVMLAHWAGAEEAAFAQQFAADPLKNALVYIQYGPSQPEFLSLAGTAADGFIWSSVLGVYADAKGQEFRKKYKAAYPGVMGLAYTGFGYDSMHILANAWGAAEPEDFAAVCSFLRKNLYRGVNGTYNVDNDSHTAVHYPLETPSLDKGLAQLYFQIQGDEHRIIAPQPLAESSFRLAPWMKG
jgi:branched-chain amino acid transport system substrate-binding protein